MLVIIAVILLSHSQVQSQYIHPTRTWLTVKFNYIRLRSFIGFSEPDGRPCPAEGTISISQPKYVNQRVQDESTTPGQCVGYKDIIVNVDGQRTTQKCCEEYQWDNFEMACIRGMRIPLKIWYNNERIADTLARSRAFVLHSLVHVFWLGYADGTFRGAWL